MLPQALPGSATIWTGPGAPKITWLPWPGGLANQTAQLDRCADDPTYSDHRTSTAALDSPCTALSLLVWGMALMARAGTIVRVVDQYSGEPLVGFSVMELDALGSHQSVRPRGASGSGLTLER